MNEAMSKLLKLLNGYWSTDKALILCEDMVEFGEIIQAKDGVCPVHHGDACLVLYVPLGAARNEVARIAEESIKPCPHIKGIVKWGIANNTRWCKKCKKLVKLEIDWSGHP